MSAVYREPILTVAVLDFLKEAETRACLESVRRHVKVEHKTVYLHNGAAASYPYQLFREGLVDQLIQTRVNNGLGIGTRDVMAASFSPYTLYLQNDQAFIRDFEQADLDAMIAAFTYVRLGERPEPIVSISLAGAPCGNEYSERCHLIQTDFYRGLESQGKLGYHGAGPYHNGCWREAQMQAHYRQFGFKHLIWVQPFVADRGTYAIRDMQAAGIWIHRPDTKRIWNIVPPTEGNPVYPQFEPFEWEQALSPAGWPDGRIPLREMATSFLHWSEDGDAAYVARLREQYGRRP